MDFINNYIINQLKHSDRADFLSDEYLRDSLWYSATNQAYPQRLDIYDSSWLTSPTVNTYVALALKSIFQLEYLNIYDTEAECNDEIDKFDDDSVDVARMDIYSVKQKSLYFSFIEKMRNGFAHGTFNKIKNRFIIISQPKPKPTEKINYYLNLTQVNFLALNEVKEFFENSLKDVITAKYWCLNSVLNFELRDIVHYSYVKKCIVIIDDDFHFDTDKRVAAIKELLEQYSSEKETVIIVSENLGSISEKNLVSENGKVRVLQQSKIIDYFELENIKI